MRRAFPPCNTRDRNEHRTIAAETDKGHGRLVRRELHASSRLAGHLEWPGLKQVCRLERTTQRGGKTVREVQYAITSLSPERANAAQLLSYWVGHWGIENRLHWVRDTVFGEDKCRVRLGHGPQNLASFRNAAISTLRLEGVKGVQATLTHFNRCPHDLLRFLGILKK